MAYLKRCWVIAHVPFLALPRSLFPFDEMCAILIFVVVPATPHPRQVVFQLVAADVPKTVASSPILRPLASGPHVGVLRRLLVRFGLETNLPIPSK